MRLINTTTVQLEDFMANPPPYAILSHTWEDGEVTFQDFTDPNRGAATSKKGFTKIQHTCRQAKQTGIAYAWVDTCCIDKTSSAELTEAINSMFAWYESSKVCYVFLSDLDPTDAVDPIEPTPKFAGSRWFTRGWTLQELIAPKVVEFYDQEWTLRGTRASLVKAIEAITQIEGQVLHNSTVLADIPVARRMSWAAKRTTTRIEDIAYCLLGIFDVSMPMLYGEGEKAFTRLQEEIAKETNDLTLFAWQARDADVSVQKYRGILANSPAEFLNAGSIIASDEPRFADEFLLTNKGLRISTWIGSGPGGIHVLNLNCSPSDDPTQQIGIYLTMHGAGTYARDQPDKFILQEQCQVARYPDQRTLQTQQLGMSGKADTIYISKRLTPSQSISLNKVRHGAFFFRTGFTASPFVITIKQPTDLWDSQQKLFLTYGMVSFTGCLSISVQESLIQKHKLMSKSFLIVCGITAANKEKQRPWIAIGDLYEHPELNRAWRSGGDGLKKLSDVGSQYENKTIFLIDSKRTKHVVISIEMENAEVDGIPMYCIDLKFEDYVSKSS